MGRILAFLSLIFIAGGIVAVDYLVLTSSATLSRLARVEIDAALGSNLEYGDLTASIDGTLVIRNVGLNVTRKKLRILSADRVDIAVARRAGTYVPESATLVAPRLTLNHEFFEEIAREPARRPLRELYPEDALPRIRCQGGQIEIIHRQFLHWSTPQAFSIVDLAFVPVSGYRYFAGGRLHSDLLGDWRLSGEFDLDSGAVHVSLTCDAVTLGPKVRAILSPAIHPDWDRYRPDGPARVRLFIDADAGEPARFRATVNPLKMSLCYEGFPYPVSEMEGELDFTGDGFVIKQLAGRNGNARIRFDGRASGYASEADFLFRIEIDSMPMDERLREALKSGARKVYDMFRPQGVFDARGLVSREYGPDKPVRTPLDIRFRNSTSRFSRFPYELEQLEGEIHIDAPFCRVKRVTGVHGPGRFEIMGVLDNLDADPTIDVHIRGENVTLDSTLKHAMEEGPRKMWERFNPSGQADIEWHVTKKKGADPQHHARAFARSCRVTYEGTPLPISEVTGWVSFSPEEVVLSHLEGKADDGARITVNGTATLTPKGWRHKYDIGAVGATVDDRFKKAMPKPIADLLDTLKLTGLVNFQLHLEMEGEGPDETMDWQIRVELRRAAIATAVRFDDIEGVVDMYGRTRAGKQTGAGTLVVQSLRVMKKKATDVAASFLLMENGDVIFTRVSGTAYSGIVTGQLKINSQTTELSGEFRVDRLELREFVRDTDSYANRALSGKVSLELFELAGKGNDTMTLTARGTLTIINGQLMEIPAAVNFLSPFASSKRFDAGKIDFKIRERRFDIKHFVFESQDGGSVFGRGYLTFDGDYAVKVQVEPVGIFGIRFFLLDIVPAIMGQFMRTTLKGNLESDKAEKVEDEPPKR